MTSTQDLVTLTANCLCKAKIFTAQILKAKLPLQGWTCHCDSCRHVTGALYNMDAPWPEPRANVDISGLKSYAFSPAYDLLFCGTCSTPMFFASTKNPEEELVVFTGTIKNGPGDFVKITKHMYVGDTKDGGASMWLRKPNADGMEVKRYKERDQDEKDEPSEPISYDWPSPESLVGYEEKKDRPVPMRCKCKGVNLVWEQGSYEGKKKEDLPWFVDPVTHKALAGFCACESCRLASGEDIWNWGFTELKDIHFPDASQQPSFPISIYDLRALVDAKDPSIGTLTYYSSSSDVQWYFCGNCSASIFYALNDRPHMVDIAIGVLEAPEGARAEGSFSWEFGGPVSWSEDNEGGWRSDLWQRVAKEAEDWRIERGYPKNWRRLAQEEAAKKA